MSTHTVIRLTPAQQQSVNVLIGECVKSVIRLLASRRKLARSGDLGETAYFQCIALGGLYLRTIECYPPSIRAEIESHAATLAENIGREG